MSTIQNFDSSVDLLSALLWQHNNAKNLTKLLELKQQWYDTNQRDFWDNWIRDVFDLRTANAFGLQVWATILGVPLTVALPPSSKTKPTYGYGVNNKNYKHGNYSSNSSTSAGLTIEQQRLVLQLRYFKLISRCTIPEINEFMAFVFKEQGKVYALDPNDMSFVIYVFDFVIGSQLAFILQNYDIMPRPAGVGIQYRVIIRKAYGYGIFNKNYGHGTYASTGG